MRRSRAMADMTMNGPAGTRNRPRLTPGIPAGGIAAALVTLAMVGWGLEEGSGPNAQVSIVPALTMHAVSAIHAPPAPPIPHAPASGRLVDMRAIAAAADAGSETAAKMAVALSEALDGRGGDVKILERAQVDATGENRVVAEAVAPAGLRLAKVHGTVAIQVDPKADRIRFEMTNSRKRYTLDVSDGLLWITGPGPTDQPTDFKITVPAGGSLLINEFAGDLKVSGDLNGPVRLDLAQGRIAFDGALQSLRARVSGTGTVLAPVVRDLLAVQMRGTGEISVGKTERLTAEMNGSGRLNVGAVGRETVLDVPGMSNVAIGTADGVVRTAVSGPGNVSIGAGRATLFEAGTAGPGNIRFGGTAEDPRVLVAATGTVTVARHTGTPRIEKTGSGDVQLGR